MPVALLVHIALLSLMAVLLAVAGLISYRKKKAWFRRHRLITLAGTVSGILGILVMFVYKLVEQESHWGTLHSKVGTAVAALILAAATMGLLLSRLPKVVRIIHRYWGRLTLVAVWVVLVLGLQLIF